MKKRLPEFADCLRLERFTGGDFCEKKNLLCYASDQSGGILLKDLTTMEERRITAGGGGESHPAFSPDGERMLFLSTLEGGRWLCLYDLETGQVRRLTGPKKNLSEPLWSPDGRRILFAAAADGGRSDGKGRDEAYGIETMNYKFDGRGYIPPDGRQQLYLVSAEGFGEIPITDGETDYLHASWGPDGKRVVCVSDRYREERGSLFYDLVLLEEIEEGWSMRRLTEGVVPVSYPNPVRPVFTPDGRYVIAGILDMEALEFSAIGYPMVYLWKFDAETGEGVRIFEADENCYQCVQFPYNAGCGWGMEKLQVSGDGAYVYFLGGWQGQCCLYRLRLGEEGPVCAEKILGGKAVCHGIGRMQNGKLLIARSEPDLPEAYYILEPGTQESPFPGLAEGFSIRKAVQSARDLLEEVSFVRPEDFSIPTLDGESRIHGWVYRPPVRPKGKAPAFLYVHGGPHPFYTYGFTMEHQCFAAAGFGVMLCNPRGSSGYGPLHQTYARATDGSAYYDCLQFVDACVRRCEWMDGSRLGVTGGSYGGWMTSYMAAHSRRFRAYITQRTAANELIQYGSSDMPDSSRGYERFEDFMVERLRESVVSYAERIDRPFLILQGEDDCRTPAENAHQLFVAIKDIHPELPVKLVIYPHTPHDQPSHPKQRMDYYQEMTDWFREYL